MKRKIKNKKGFAMAELLAVSMVILLLFSILFSNYLPLVVEYENRVSYNNVTAQYAAHSVRKILYEAMKSINGEETALELNIKNVLKQKTYYKILPNNTSFCENTILNLSNEKKATCEKIIQEYNIEEIIITKYQLDDLKDNENGYQKNETLYNYIKYLPKYEKTKITKEPYRIIIKTEYGYATTPIKTDNMCETRKVSSDQSDANAPQLDDGIIPVYYDECDGNWKVASIKNEGGEYQWYNYDEKIWANSVTVSSTNRSTYLNAEPGTTIPMDDILTMQVWIPRYKYKVWNYNADGTVTSEPQEIEITWEKGTDKTGEIECQDNIQGAKTTERSASEVCKLKSENATCTDNTCNKKTYTHPAFTFGDDELTGFWIGKFEISTPQDDECYATLNATNCNKTGITPLVKPNVKSYRYAQVATFETNMMAMNDNNNIYGLNTTTDTHMIKNSEWGAVAYLSHSKYGTCDDGICREVYINNSEHYYTGRSGGSENAIATSYGNYSYEGKEVAVIGKINGVAQKEKIASTTGNIYGVYDMNGGSREYTMSNIINKKGDNQISGSSINSSSGHCGEITNFDFVITNGCINFPEKKYYDKYSYTSDRNSLKASKLGDAIKEVYCNKNSSNSYAWYSDTDKFVNYENPWFFRGGISKVTDENETQDSSGIFASSYGYGEADQSYSTRVIIVTE